MQPVKQPKRNKKIYGKNVHVVFDETVYKEVKLQFKDLGHETYIHSSIDF